MAVLRDTGCLWVGSPCGCVWRYKCTKWRHQLLPLKVIFHIFPLFLVSSSIFICGVALVSWVHGLLLRILLLFSRKIYFSNFKNVTVIKHCITVLLCHLQHSVNSMTSLDGTWDAFEMWMRSWPLESEKLVFTLRFHQKHMSSLMQVPVSEPQLLPLQTMAYLPHRVFLVHSTG